MINGLSRVKQDVWYGCRMLAASPAFSIVAVLSLAIGIGANCAIFSFADALLLRPLPVARPGEVYTVGSTATLDALNASSLVSSYPDYVDIRDRSRSFQGLAAFAHLTVGFAADTNAAPRLKMGMLVSGNLFPLMGVEPTIGRGFRADEDNVRGRDAVVVLGRGMFEQDFGASPAVLGRTVRINGIPFTVIGVAPPAFTGMDQFVRADFFMPLAMSPRVMADTRTGSLDVRSARNLRLKGRLAPGVSQAQAQAELTSIAADLQRQYPDTNKNRGLAIRTELQSRIFENPPDTMLIAMLSTLALAVLLVACGNVAGLLTSRAPVRAREMALRLAIGAGRATVVQQLITESLLIALAGGVLGLGVGYAGTLLFRQVEIPTDLPIALAFQMDRRALFVSLAVATASAVLFGLVPAIQATRADLTAVMKAGDAVAPGRRRRWGRAVLVGGQVTVSVVLLVVAMFMYRGFGAELAGGPGYRTDHILMMSFDPTLIHYSDEQSKQFFTQVAGNARHVPGVQRVALTSNVPMANDQHAIGVAPEGFRFPEGREQATVLAAMVDEHYLELMDIPLLRGRNFRAEDDDDAPRVAIVNEELARHYWPNQDAIGKRFRTNDQAKSWVEIVGVAKRAKYVFIAEPPSEFVYVPYRQRAQPQMVLLARTDGDPASLAAPLRDVARRLDANLPIYNVRTMAQLYEMRATRVFNVLITMVGAMGLMGLALAIVGLYGLVAYAASRRTREIGIRMAIGATGDTVLRLVLRQGLTLAIAGLGVGLVASIGAGSLLAAAFPNGGNQQDLMALVVVAPVVLAVTALAAYLPARRASRINPMQALRHD